jgi:hypothetical protein
MISGRTYISGKDGTIHEILVFQFDPETKFQSL